MTLDHDAEYEAWLQRQHEDQQYNAEADAYLQQQYEDDMAAQIAQQKELSR